MKLSGTVTSSQPQFKLGSSCFNTSQRPGSCLELTGTAAPEGQPTHGFWFGEDQARYVLAVADGCIVGSALKHGGDTWAAVDPDRAADFMARVRTARGGK